MPLPSFRTDAPSAERTGVASVSAPPAATERPAPTCRASAPVTETAAAGVRRVPTEPAPSSEIAAAPSTTAVSLCVGTPAGVQLAAVFQEPSPPAQVRVPVVAAETVTDSVLPSALRENA